MSLNKKVDKQNSHSNVEQNHHHNEDGAVGLRGRERERESERRAIVSDKNTQCTHSHIHPFIVLTKSKHNTPFTATDGHLNANICCLRGITERGEKWLTVVLCCNTIEGSTICNLKTCLPILFFKKNNFSKKHVAHNSSPLLFASYWHFGKKKVFLT